jgi:hypothetical protein
MKKWPGLIALITLAACAQFPEPREVPQTGVAGAPVIETDPVTGRKSVEIGVLIYNVYGLPWPLKSNPPTG